MASFGAGFGGADGFSAGALGVGIGGLFAGIAAFCGISVPTVGFFSAFGGTAGRTAASGCAVSLAVTGCRTTVTGTVGGGSGVRRSTSGCSTGALSASASATIASTASATAASFWKRTSSLFGCTLTSTVSYGMVRCSTHVGYLPDNTRSRHAASTAADKIDDFIYRPLMKNDWWFRLPRPLSPTPTKPFNISPD